MSFFKENVDFQSCKKSKIAPGGGLQRKKIHLRRAKGGSLISKGSFKEGTITKWSIEAEEIFNKFKNKKNIIIGSSMGGWISLIVTKKNLNHIHGVIGIASAPDFIVEQWDKLSKNEQLEFKKTGSMFFPDPDHGDYEVSYKFVNDGFNNLLLIIFNVTINSI